MVMLYSEIDGTLFTIYFSGSKECYDEPKNLRQKLREALQKEVSDNGKTSENAESEQSSNTKEAHDESVKKRDKV